MDIMGKAIREYHLRRDNSPIHLRIDGIKDNDMPPSLFFRPYSRMKTMEKEALSMVRGKILDVGAGAGCHALWLQKTGNDVVALDYSEPGCETMRERGIKDVINKSIFDLEGQKFDTILMLMNGFGIAGSLDRLPELLAHLKSLLRPGGMIIGDSTDISYFDNEREAIKRSISTKKYFGDVEFELKYKALIEVFPWVYPDPEAMEIAARSSGLECKIVKRSRDASYLVRLD